MVIACKSNNFYLYNRDKDQFGVQINFDAFKDFNDWLIMPLPSKCVDTFRNKFIGSSFDNFAKEYNLKKSNLNDEMILFIKEWIVEHILKEDMKFKSAIKDT